MNRPDAVIFDVVETLFPLEPLRSRLIAAGLPGTMLETWFASFLRDAFALEIAGGYRPFGEIAAAALARLLRAVTGRADDAAIATIMSGFALLDPHEDVAPAFDLLAQEGVRIAALSNGSAKIATALFERAGLRGMLEAVISIDEVRRWKPNAAVYRHAVARLGLAPDRVALIAAHAWDLEGAKRAGLMTGYVARGGMPPHAAMMPPDVEGATLTETVRNLLKTI
ncbi:MAG: haloacid dehalogenase type II [Rhodothalassiaceae bacterium]